MERWVVDRLEGGFAVCEDADGNRREFPLGALPDDVHEGAVIVVDGAQCRLDPEEEARLREEAIQRKNRLFRRRGEQVPPNQNQ